MKKLLLALTLIALLAVPCFAGEISIQEKSNEIMVAEVKPDGVSAILDTVRILAITKTAEITFRNIDATGDPTGDEFTVIIQDKVDDPETEEDETDTSFTDSGLLKAVEQIAKDVTKGKLGIE